MAPCTWNEPREPTAVRPWALRPYNTPMLHAMIMAGGGGTRFWPRSRARRPKQFLTFTGDRSLLQGTADRIAPLIPAARTWVLTGAAHVEEASRQLPDVPADHLVG